jgi:hypothetical protein
MTSTQWFQLSIIILPITLLPLISLSAVLYQHLLQRLPQQKRFCYHHSIFAAR